MAKKEKMEEKEKEFDVDKEIERLSRPTRINIMKSQNSFESRLNQLDKDIEDAISAKEKLFDETKELTSKHIMTNYTDNALERYKNQLRKI
ncbi:hypothetical protein [uncultured Methanobrevibacter sp.]|uniref:hypothetical protein n=1 Tax=uncultured Methanobrevibacter sp. TaxID=253161 RepID=UPI0025FA581A|nr:hypothetical protein [uncultured Methanobrevibacter sp.]